MVHAGDALRMLTSKGKLLELIKICFANFSHNSQTVKLYVAQKEDFESFVM